MILDICRKCFNVVELTKDYGWRHRKILERLFCKDPKPCIRDTSYLDTDEDCCLEVQNV